MKYCGSCEQFKDLEAFSTNKSKRDGLSSCCKGCHSEYVKQHYINNKEKYLRAAAKRNKTYEQEIKEYIFKVKDAPCMDCGIKYPPYVMDFDHREPEQKEFNISYAVRLKSPLRKIQEEIDKCDLVCANCHRIRTWQKEICSLSVDGDAVVL